MRSPVGTYLFLTILLRYRCTWNQYNAAPSVFVALKWSVASSIYGANKGVRETFIQLVSRRCEGGAFGELECHRRDVCGGL